MVASLLGHDASFCWNAEYVEHVEYVWRYLAHLDL